MNKKSQIKAIRGMNDILPVDTAIWRQVCADVLSNYGYQQIRTPLLESTYLFARSIGADTDIVAKEMYTFEDRNGDSLTLRPEGTASCVRAGIENGLFYNQQQRLWYQGPMFRHERPQKGRYRQFYQVGAESYGWSGVDIEAEMLSLTAQIFTRLGLEKTRLQINSLGDVGSRAAYREALVSYLQDFTDRLDEDSQRRMTTNPLRILDSKNAEVQNVLEGAPSILDFLSDKDAGSLAELQDYLGQLGVEYQINPKLVRGLDYYNNTVFEWVNDDFGAQSTVCAGGRYDGLVEQLGGVAMPAIGFAMGLERLVQILQEQGAAITVEKHNPSVFIVSIGVLARGQALTLQQQLTDADISTVLYCGEGSIKNQFKRADKSGAAIALIIGEQEAATKEVGLKPLMRHEEQQTIRQNDALNVVTNVLESL